jgi:glycosyltransferase involved in cell wall biosynthesis
MVHRARKTISAPRQSCVIICVANFVSEKQHHVLLKAFASAKREIENLFLVLVGKGELEHHVRQSIAGLGLEQASRIVGDCVNPLPLLCSADVAVLTSSIEGCSNALLEAMAMGLPIVASDAGGNRELVKNNVGGFICPIGDVAAFAQALMKLAQDRTLATTMGRYNVERIKKLFTDDIMIERTMELYEQVLSKKGLRTAQPSRAMATDWKTSYQKEA